MPEHHVHMGKAALRAPVDAPTTLIVEEDMVDPPVAEVVVVVAVGSAEADMEGLDRLHLEENRPLSTIKISAKRSW
jgi:hypothetical protein